MFIDATSLDGKNGNKKRFHSFGHNRSLRITGALIHSNAFGFTNIYGEKYDEESKKS